MTGFPRTGRHTSMKKLVAALTVLLLALQIPAPSSARRSLGRNWGRSLASPPSHRGTLAVDLLPYHHYNSPFAQLNLTLSERVQIAVRSSEARAEFLASEISGKSATFGSGKVYTSPLQYEGSYIMKISLGTPPRSLWAIADTGSTVTWVQCIDCLRVDCYPQVDPYFDPQASSSYSTIPCTDPVCAIQLGATISCSTISTCLYQIRYLDQSGTRGNLASETLTLNGTDGLPQPFSSFTFGCGNNQSGSFVRSADGLVGLGKGALSLIYQLGSAIDYTFSYCLVDFSVSLSKISPLLLGSVGDLPLTYTPMLINPFGADNFYYLDIIGITVNGVPLNYPTDAFGFYTNTREGGMIIDSGTIISRITAAVYNPFINRLSSLINYPRITTNANFDLCYDISQVTNPTYPDVVLQFTNLDLALPSDNLIWSIGGNTVCVAFRRTAQGTTSILGAVQQQNFQIAYDLRNDQIGFAPTIC